MRINIFIKEYEKRGLQDTRMAKKCTFYKSHKKKPHSHMNT